VTYTIDTLKTKTLGQVSDLYREGSISRDLAEQYAALWNAGPHFTTAIVGACTIINVDKD